MQEWPATDSRDYIVAFGLNPANDCPPDFDLPASAAGFDAGLFRPRGDRDWFGRPSYPPRVLLLKRGTLYIVSHPAAGEPPRQCAMQEISCVESGHFLLKGWLRFSGSGFDYTVRYNTRGFPPVFQFMRRFQEELLGPPLPSTSALAFEAGLDLKFANALALELECGETIAVQAFQPPRGVVSRSWLLPHRRWMAGDLLALTSRRLLWITDRERGWYSRYGSIASYAPLGAVRAIRLASARGADILQVNLNHGSQWQIPIALEGQGVADEFAAALEVQKRRADSGIQAGAERT